ncbi:CPBP family intramembrane metalloprotease [Clostridium estertheticum]|uniref:CPBP family intramembrane glutamic endopeptidase n=1 Tax=Clostridium estertheticum TaxID=238834 RepID=UPI001C7CB674|nr:type II CAAX endopeptidase family protein [Clostridium estertheticum]MBX4258374.1 CPBP family intramembrane metalloprotease [Clostridium estertheticum]WLC69667.1 CPBP family intramembrane metalloprotease [Clostridium estertheticum]
MKQEDKLLKKIGLFLLYTFSITWLSCITIIIGNRYFNALWYGQPLYYIPTLIGAMGPAISSYIIYRQFNEDFDNKSFAKFIFGKKINRNAWLIFGSYIIWRLFMVWISFGINDVTSILYIFLNLPLFLIGGGFEELGWRGYLQPQLEKVVNYFPSVLIVGIIWSMWHLPLWLIKGTPQSAIPFGLYAFLGVVLSFTFTTIYKYTKNLLLCVLSHAWFDGCIGLAVYIGSEGYLQLNLNWKVFLVFILELIVSVILGIAYNRKKSIKINNKIRLS